MTRASSDHLDRSRPFTAAAGLADGISRRELRSSAYRCLLRGVHIAADAHVDEWVWGRAALLAGHPRAFLSHHSAARLYGAVVPDTHRPHVSVPAGVNRSNRQDILVHRSSRTPVRFRGLPVTSAHDTFLDLAVCLNLVDLVVLGDSLVRKRRTTPAELLSASREATGSGSRLARQAAALVRSGVDSPMESRARMLRVLSGLPELETDIRFYDDAGNLLRRLDAGDRATRTATEYDGRQHIEREQSWEADLGRREEFEDLEWRIVTLVSKDIYTTPDRTVLRLERIYRARGMKFGPLRDDYRAFFQGRG